MFNSKMIAVVGFSLLSSVALADAVPTAPSAPSAPSAPTEPAAPLPGRERVAFFCKLGDREDPRWNNIRCEAFGHFCRERDIRDQRRCEEDIRIRCSNGVRLEDRDPAVAFEDRRVFINAVEDDRLATLEIRRLLGEDGLSSDSANDPERRGREAKLLIQLTRREAAVLRGECELRERDDFNSSLQ